MSRIHHPAPADSDHARHQSRVNYRFPLVSRFGSTGRGDRSIPSQGVGGHVAQYVYTMSRVGGVVRQTEKFRDISLSFFLVQRSAYWA